MVYHNPHIKGQYFITNKSPKQQKRGPFFSLLNVVALGPFRRAEQELQAPWPPTASADGILSYHVFILPPYALLLEILTPFVTYSARAENSLPLQFFPGCYQSSRPIPGCVQSHSKCYVRTSPHASHVVVLLVLNLGVTRIDPNLFRRKLVPEQFENWITAFFAVCDVDG